MVFWRLCYRRIVTLLIGVMVLGVSAQGQPFSPPPRGMGGQPSTSLSLDREALFARLNLTAQQRTQIINLMNETQDKIRQLLTRLHEQRTQLMQLYQQYQFDEKAAQRIMQGINQTQAELLKVHHENQKQLRRILDRDQFEQWNQWWKERMFFPPKGDWGRRGRGGKQG
mgnify:CR=1 FL=1|jgi:Spy/CpxP family protein refolding chaperone